MLLLLATWQLDDGNFTAIFSPLKVTGGQLPETSRKSAPTFWLSSPNYMCRLFSSPHRSSLKKYDMTGNLLSSTFCSRRRKITAQMKSDHFFRADKVSWGTFYSFSGLYFVLSSKEKMICVLCHCWLCTFNEIDVLLDVQQEAAGVQPCCIADKTFLIFSKYQYILGFVRQSANFRHCFGSPQDPM